MSIFINHFFKKKKNQNKIKEHFNVKGEQEARTRKLTSIDCYMIYFFISDLRSFRNTKNKCWKERRKKCER